MKYKIQFFEEIDSTNAYALKMAPELADFTVICAKQQTAGRGRKGRKWHSHAGDNLYFSLLLKSPDVRFEELSGIPQLMALAVQQTLLQCGLKISWIKWPNDVLVDDKKICGVLCESRLQGNKLDALIIGVGININTSQEEIDAIDKPATSLLLEIKDDEPFAAKEILHVVLMNFEKLYKTWLIKEQRGQLVDNWRLATRLIGKAVTLEGDNTKIYGTVVDFTECGELILQTEKGFQTFSYGDLSLRY
ncbi:MAG: biotin--[acetyl-CoA-carboxylase] ligase [Lentisphaeraceae bacterium]|nr:biotin--[acetyl-CoA-carboxylase] ligase [Lentisphaeraceae bacterium]